MKKCLLPIAILTIIAICFCVFGFVACKPSYTINYSAIEENGEIVAYSVEGSTKSKVIEIPAEYNGKPVTEIGEYAFKEGAFLFVELEKITIPDSVTKIGSNALCQCDELTDIYFGGTKTQWEAIDKGSDWNNGAGRFSDRGFYIIHCTDGDIIQEPVYE